MASKKKKTTIISLVIAAIGVFAGLITNWQTIEKWWCPYCTACEEACDKIRVLEGRWQRAGLITATNDLITETRLMLNQYYMIEKCRPEVTEGDISLISEEVVRLVGLSLNKQRKEPDEQIRKNLHGLMELLRLLCANGQCTSEQNQALNKIESILQ